MAGHRVFRGMVSGRFFFAPKVRDAANGLQVVMGQKYDITDDLQPFLLKRYRKKDGEPASPRRYRRRKTNPTTQTG